MKAETLTLAQIEELLDRINMEIENANGGNQNGDKQ